MNHINEQATAEFFIIDSVSSWMGNVTAHGNDLHEKMLLVCEARINERIMLVFNDNFNKN